MTLNPAPKVAAKQGAPCRDSFKFTIDWKGSKIHPGIAHERPRGAWEHHATLIPNTPIRIHVTDRDSLITRDNDHDWVLANERMVQVHAGIGHPCQFVVAATPATAVGRLKPKLFPSPRIRLAGA